MGHTIQWVRRRRVDVPPATPEAPEATNVTASTAVLTWPSVEGADLYNLERSTNQTQWTTVYGGAAPTFNQTGLAAVTTYYYRVSAANEGGSSSPSPVTAITTTAAATTVPATPAAPVASDIGSTSATLTWTAVPSATSYLLERSPHEVATTPTTPTTPTTGATAFTATPADAVVDPLVGYSYTFNWSGDPAGTMYQVRLDNGPWTQLPPNTTSRAITISGIKELDVTYHTFHVAPRYQDGTYGPILTHNWRVGMHDFNRFGMSGTVRHLAIRAQWTGATLKHGTAAQNNAVLDEAIAGISEVSRGAVTMTYTFTNVLTIAAPASTATVEQVSKAAYDAAVAAGVVMSNYDHIIVFSPDSPAQGSTINGAALQSASVGGKKGVWAGSSLDPSVTYGPWVVMHEVLHSLGMGHDNRFNAPITSAVLNGAATAYGDYGSVMGNLGEAVYPSAPHMSRTPWVQTKNVTLNGSYTISSIETAGNTNPHVLLLNVTNTVNPTKRQYWISLRQATGIDATLGNATFKTLRGDFTSGISIHAPASDGYAVLALGTDFPLKPGSTFTDPDGAVTITCTSKTASTAVVTIAGLPATPGAAALVQPVEVQRGVATWTQRYSGTALTFTDTGLTQTTDYDYRLTASNSFGASSPSPIKVVTTTTPPPVPAKPAAPTFTNVATTTATVSWAAVADADTYTLQRSTNQTTWNQAYSGPNRTFAATGLTAATAYYYRVSASNETGTSAFSTAGTFTTRAAVTPGTGTVTPFSSKKLWMRYGMQTFPHFKTRVYASHPNAITAYMNIIKDMGIAYVRMQCNNELKGSTQLEQLAAMKAAGIKFIGGVAEEAGVVPTTTPIAEVRRNVIAIRDNPEIAKLCLGIEGVNEPNHNRGTLTRADGTKYTPPVPTDWAAQTAAVSLAISQEMRRNSNLDHADRQGPALHDGAAEKSYQTLTPAYHAASGGKRHWHQMVAEGILDLIDIQVTHSYPGGEAPLNNYPARAELIRSAYGADFPMWVNEWGYKGSAGAWRDSQYISPTAMQYYDDRAVFIFGIEEDVPVCRFELLDDPLIDPDGVKRDDVQKHFGIVETPDYNPTTWERKPSANRLKAILQELKDPGADYVPDPIKLTVNKNGNTNVHWHCVAKRDGTATLFAWNNVDVWNRTTDSMFNVPDVTIEVTDSLGTRNMNVGKEVRWIPIDRRPA